jgi:hypothetical protein
VHGHDTSAEIEAAFGVLITESPWIHRECVLWNDLALGPSLFHWESQSTTTATFPTGQRSIHHASRGSRVLLYRCAEACGYVREQRKQDVRPGAPTESFVCLGFARYESHEGERPMARGNLYGGWSGRSGAATASHASRRAAVVRHAASVEELPGLQAVVGGC